jgi:hypothetical protein
MEKALLRMLKGSKHNPSRFPFSAHPGIKNVVEVEKKSLVLQSHKLQFQRKAKDRGGGESFMAA